MNEITTAITGIKTRLSLHEWQQRILDCQNSGMSVKDWCHKDHISTGSNYFHIFKIRESVLEENKIVPLEKSKPASSYGIRIDRKPVVIAGLTSGYVTDYRSFRTTVS